MLAGERDPLAWWARLITVRRRRMVAGLWLTASAVMYRATVSGVAGKAARPCRWHHVAKCSQSAWYARRELSALAAARNPRVPSARRTKSEATGLRLASN